MLNNHQSDRVPSAAAPDDEAGRAADERPEPGTLWRTRRTGQVDRVVSVTGDRVRLESLGSGTLTLLSVAEFNRGRVFVGRLRSGD